METQRTAINTANSEYTENGINRLNNYGFQKLISDNYSDPLIKVSKTNPENRNIQIRLFDNYPFESEILVSNQDIGKPLRYNGDSFSISSATILQGLDVNTTNLDEESPTYFVLLYAVSVSTLNLSQRIYSSLCPLGYIQLP